jgi:hypothetical protein
MRPKHMKMRPGNHHVRRFSGGPGLDVVNFPREFKFTCACALHAFIHHITCSHASNFSREFEFTCACALHACMHVHIPFLRYYKNQPRMSASKSMQGVARVSMHGMKLDLFPDVCHCPVLSARARGLFPTCTCVFVRWKQRTE